MAGCAKPAAPDLFVNQRGVTTRPAPDEHLMPDAMVHFDIYQLEPLPNGKPHTEATLPPDAKPVTSVETLVVYDRRFYCSILQEKYRLEIGGIVSQLNDRIRSRLEASEHSAWGVRGFKTTIENDFPLRKPLVGLYGGMCITYSVEPLKPPATPKPTR